MIKRDWNYDYSSVKLIPSSTYSCRGRLRTRWCSVSKTEFVYDWKKPEEELLAPACLSTWSK